MSDAKPSTTRTCYFPRYVLGIRAVAVLLMGLGAPALVYACYWMWCWVTATSVFDIRSVGSAGFLYQVFSSRDFWGAVWSWMQSSGGVALASFGIGVAIFLRAHRLAAGCVRRTPILGGVQ